MSGTTHKTETICEIGGFESVCEANKREGDEVAALEIAYVKPKRGPKKPMTFKRRLAVARRRLREERRAYAAMENREELARADISTCSGGLLYTGAYENKRDSYYQKGNIYYGKC